MPWVTIRGSHTKYPVACACCLKTPTTTLVVEKVKTLHLGVARIRRTFRSQVPYCSTCKDHALEHESAQPGQVLLGGIGILLLTAGVEYCGVSCAMKVLPDPSPHSGSPNPIGLAVFVVLGVLPWVLAGVFVVRGLLRRPRIVQVPPHACATRAARVHDFEAEQHTLVFENAEFWSRCVRANGDSVVAKG